MQTYMANPDKIERKWYVVDADGCTLGRLASGVASVLRGKNKPQFTPHVDTGDYVIIVNADKIKVTGKKLEQKIYYNHSDYVGGMRETTLKEMLAKKPERVIELAVKGMLPKGPLGRSMYTKLFALFWMVFAISFVTTVPSSARISPVEASTTSSASL